MKENVSYSEQMRKILSSICPLSQTRNGFIDSEEEINFIPFYQFRFLMNSDNTIYLKIKEIIESFEGNLEWTLMSDDCYNDKRLHTIIPKKYSNINVRFGCRMNALGLVKKEQIFQNELYGYEVFSDTIYKAIKDIPNLIEYLKKIIEKKSKILY